MYLKSLNASTPLTTGARHTPINGGPNALPVFTASGPGLPDPHAANRLRSAYDPANQHIFDSLRGGGHHVEARAAAERCFASTPRPWRSFGRWTVHRPQVEIPCPTTTTTTTAPPTTTETTTRPPAATGTHGTVPFGCSTVVMREAGPGRNGPLRAETMSVPCPPPRGTQATSTTGATTTARPSTRHASPDKCYESLPGRTAPPFIKPGEPLLVEVPCPPTEASTTAAADTGGTASSPAMCEREYMVKHGSGMLGHFTRQKVIEPCEKPPSTRGLCNVL